MRAIRVRRRRLGLEAADADSEKESAPAEAAPRAAARKPAAAKPAAAIPAAAKPVAPKPVDSVTEAERYIYGRGVGQDCDHGLRLLKPAAAQSNVKAMISLGALYSTGSLYAAGFADGLPVVRAGSAQGAGQSGAAERSAELVEDR